MNRFDLKCLIDYFLITALISLILLNIFGLTDSYFAVVFSLIISGYLPGWMLTRFTNIIAGASTIETLVLPFVLSVPVSALIFFVFLLLPNINPLCFLGMYLIFFVLTLIKTRTMSKEPCFTSEKISFQLFPFLILVVVVAFFVFTMANIYPQMALIPDLDIARHFSWAKQLLLTPTTYVGNELWFHIQESSFYLFSKSSIQVFQTTLAFLSVFSVLAFYLMSKTYLRDIDERLPALSTILWGVSSGFGWIYFLKDEISNQGLSTYSTLLYDSSNHSYWDTGYGQGWLWFWYRPLTLGLTILFVLLYFLRDHKLGRKSFMLFFTILLLSLNFVHFPESIVFVGLLLFLSVLNPLRDLRLFEAGLSATLSMLISFVLLFAYSSMGMSINGPDSVQLLLLAGMTALSVSLVHYGKKLEVKKLRVNSDSITALLVTGLGVVYLWLLLSWLTTAGSFSITQVASVLSVPWQFYPMLLGLGGLFAIPASKIVLKRHPYHPITLFIILLVLAILFGRLLTFINVSYYNTDYWERRIVPIAYAAACVLGSITILELFDRLRKKRPILLAIVISLIVFSATSSTFLAIELQTQSIKNNTLSTNDLQAVNMLSQLDADKVLLTVTDSSLSIAQLAPAAWLVNYYRYQLWPAQSPELPLNVLFSLNKQACVFLRDADIEEINQKYSSGYIASRLLADSSFVSNSSSNGYSIAVLPNMTAPTAKSDTMLVLPIAIDQSIWYAYGVLSQSNCNYSTARIDDVSAISEARTLIVPTESVASQLLQYKNLYNLNFTKLIVLNIDGYGDIALNCFSGSKVALSIDNASKEDAVLLSNGVESNSFESLMTPIDFEISSKYGNGDFLPLLEGSFESWVPMGIGSGNISIPDLNIDYENSIVGDSSVGIKVHAGNFSYWQITKHLTEPLNASNYDFLSFYWYGKNDQKSYVLQFHSDSSSNYWYSFKDTWQGWKKVVIPMRSPDGSFNLNGVFFTKVTNGKPDWSNIIRVDVRNEGSSPNLSGEFNIDHLGFESAKTINVTLETPRTDFFRVYNYNGSDWTNIGELTSNEAASATDYVLSNGLNSATIFGERALLQVTFVQKSYGTSMNISARLPPFLNDRDSCSIILRIAPELPKVKLTEISNSSASLFLANPVYAPPITTNNTVTSWYRGEQTMIPFSVIGSINGSEYIYVNVYPLINDIQNDTNNYSLLSKVLSASGMPISLEKASADPERPVQGKLTTFEKAYFEGEIAISSDRSTIIQSDDGTIMLSFNDTIIKDLSKMVLIKGELELNMHNCSLNGGEGFYSVVHSSMLSVKSNDLHIGPVILEFSNNTQLVTDISSSEIQIVGNSVSILRQPRFQISGNIKFVKFYTYALLSTNPGILGDDANLRGSIAFKVAYGDTFTVTDDFSYNGQFTQVHEKYNYDEANVVMNSLPLLVMICLIYLVFYLLRDTPKPTGNAEKN
jgi:hypothetical protein